VTPSRPGIGLPLAGGLALAAAMPPAWFPGAPFLVFAGLAMWFLVARDERRPGWHSYLLGCVHMAMFSWSVRHVLFFAWAMIVVVGGLYYLLVKVAVRLLPAAAAAPGFAVAVAASCWLRANMPEIWYPHGQPCHALWQWPALLRSLALGGEPLANALFAFVAASFAVWWSSWRLASPSWRSSCRLVGIACGSWLVCTAAGHLAPFRSEPSESPPLAVVVIEPGIHLQNEMLAVPEPQRAAKFWRLFEERLLAPTRAQLAAPPPDVVLWPESSVFERDDVAIRDLDAGTARLRSLAGKLPASAACLVLGTNVRGDGPPTPAAVMIELPSARIVGHQEKRCLVPGGEFQPFLTWLPRSVSDTLREWFEKALGSLPEATPGRELPPLRTAGGVPFGALLCYDNAFPGPSAAQVAQGARWLCVLSNESWYEGGDELTQLMAMTVVRAIETRTPIVRCTQDGWSGLVDADGELAAALPLAPSQPAARILRVAVAPGPGRLPPLACHLRLYAGVKHGRNVNLPTSAGKCKNEEV